MRASLINSVAVLAALALPAQAASIIDNGTIQLGVDDYGQLNVPGGTTSAGGVGVTGLRDLRTGFESTAPGCLCEGWGAGVADAGGVEVTSGHANNAYGISNLSLVSFTSTASTATSVVDLGSTLRITHAFAPATETDDLYRVSVTIRNISGADIGDLRYTRTMDWDVEPTAFSEYVTIGGTAAATSVLYANNDGFQSGNPFGSRSPLLAGAVGDFTDLGPFDHGALFDFGFGTLLADTDFSFDIFYGASTSEANALNALNAAGAEVYSLGQSGDDMTGTAPGRATFIFGFAGVGGEVVPPATVPVPASALLLFGGLGMMGALRRRRPAA